jgi:putative transcriptional regulator
LDHFGPEGERERDVDMVTRARWKDDGTVVEILRDGSERPILPEVDWARIDGTTEAEIAVQIAADDAEAMRDAAAYARRVRRKIGLSQVAFAKRIGVPVDTVRNWEQGKRVPQGPARALLRSSIAPPKPRFRLSTEFDWLSTAAPATPTYSTPAGRRASVWRTGALRCASNASPAPFGSPRGPVPPSATLSNQG